MMAKTIGADNAADAGGGDAGAERPRRLPLLGERIAVKRRRGIVAVAGNAEHDAGDLAAGAVHRVHGQQEDRARHHVHAVDERDGHRDRQLAADARRHADQQSEDHGDQHETHDVGRAHQAKERSEHGVDHCSINPPIDERQPGLPFVMQLLLSSSTSRAHARLLRWLKRQRLSN